MSAHTNLVINRSKSDSREQAYSVKS